MMPVMAVVMTAADGLRKILNVRKLTALRGVGEVRCELVKLAGRRRISITLGGLGSILQIRGDLLGDLLIFGGIGLLELLELAQHFRERGKLPVV